MELVLDRLLGVKNRVAGHISRTILSPAARIDLMRALLERAPQNSGRPTYFDEIIAEFQAVTKLRNQYAHGKWETCDQTGDLYLVRPNDDPYMLGTLVAEKFDLSEMQETKRRIFDLMMRVYREVGVEPEQEHPE